MVLETSKAQSGGSMVAVPKRLYRFSTHIDSTSFLPKWLDAYWPDTTPLGEAPSKVVISNQKETAWGRRVRFFSISLISTPSQANSSHRRSRPRGLNANRDQHFLAMTNDRPQQQPPVMGQDLQSKATLHRDPRERRHLPPHEINSLCRRWRTSVSTLPATTTSCWQRQPTNHPHIIRGIQCYHQQYATQHPFDKEREILNAVHPVEKTRITSNAATTDGQLLSIFHQDRVLTSYPSSKASTNFLQVRSHVN